MPNSFSIKVFEKKTTDLSEKVLFESEVDNSFRIGRQSAEESEEVQLVHSLDVLSKMELKLVIAHANEREYSRRFAEISLLNDRAEVKNTSSSQPIFYGAATPINPQESRIITAPFEITLCNRVIALAPLGKSESQDDIRSLPPVAPPNLKSARSASQTIIPNLSLLVSEEKNTFDGERLIELLQAMMQILQDSPSCQEFFDNATNAMAQLLDLDQILIAFDADHAPAFGSGNRSWNKWCSQSFFSRQGGAEEWSPSSKILDLVHHDKQTVFQIPDERTKSLVGVKSLVASPLKNAADDVIGVVYGDRGNSSQIGFTKTEAMFVELFANGISVGLERMGQERQISQMRARFDQFFTPSLARQLESDPAMLEPRSAEVSILFADIRGFSRISERIGPEKTIKWINSVMSQLSDCVFHHDGVVVDYIGDEIMAMWGAPLKRNDHADLAVHAALDMIKQLPTINQQWEKVVGEPVEIGIGINSGDAHVGNTGSERKFKYGPLGDVVNVGSRLQGATKQLQARLLIAESTASKLSPELIRRKIRSVRFVNVKRAVTVYEIPFRPDDDWTRLKNEYEKGLELYENGDLAQASQQLSSVITRWKDDGPSMLLLSDSVKWLQLNVQDFDFVWQLDQK